MTDNTALQYIDDQLHMESASLSNIADQVGTPFYCYSASAIGRQIARCQSAFSSLGASIHYAVKANSNLSVLQQMANAGLGADIVSSGELARALKAGIDPSKIIFSGVGKRADELLMALEVGIAQFNLESVPELEQLAFLAEQHGCVAQVSVRVNPEVDAATHKHITTGVKGNKFGVPLEQLEYAFELIENSAGLALRGLAVHIGSQIVESEPYRAVCKRLHHLVTHFRAQGHAISHLDLGGGFGIDYGDGRFLPYDEVAKVIEDELQGLDVQIAIEPGRSLVAAAGVLVTEVIYRKEVEPTPFLIIDAAMNDLMRPALYQAQHRLLPLAETNSERELCNLVGPICESTDTFQKGAHLPHLEAGQCVALLDAGAYGAVMASGYNSRDIIPEVMVRDGKFNIVRQRITQSDLMMYEPMPII